MPVRVHKLIDALGAFQVLEVRDERLEADAATRYTVMQQNMDMMQQNTNMRQQRMKMLQQLRTVHHNATV